MAIHRVIGLEEFANSGKSSILRQVAKCFLKANTKPQSFAIYERTNWRKVGCRTLLNQDVDVTVVIEINGRVIVIVTGGDEEEVLDRVRKLLNKINVRDVDILVAAMRFPKVSKAYEKMFGDCMRTVFKIPCKRWRDIPKNHKAMFESHYVGAILQMINEK